jgi:orotate phosphoribosyltransferase
MTPMDRQTLAARINDRCRLVGTFTLRSGQISDHYFDKYLFEADPYLLREVAEHAVALVPPGTEVLAGLELGGVAIATALSLASGLPAAFVRKVAKSYGTAKLAEGADVAGRRVLVVEDVVTTGGQVLMSTEDLRLLGAKVEHVLCAIDRGDGAHESFQAAGLSLTSLFTASDLDAADAARVEQPPHHRNARRVQEALAGAGSTARVIELDSSARTAAEAAESLGVEVGQIVKSLVFVADGAPVLLLVAGDHRVDPIKAAAALGAAALVRADADVVREASGFPIGGVAPVGHRRPMRALIDASLARFDEIWAAAGTPHAVFPTSLPELTVLTGGAVADLG